jgi:intracellular sulfur oxidation DsrE/DsrF family protein
MNGYCMVGTMYVLSKMRPICGRIARISLAGALLIACAFPSLLAAAGEPLEVDIAERVAANRKLDEGGTYDNPIALRVTDGVKVVYQVKTDAWKQGVAAGLHYVDKLSHFYDKMDIRSSNREIVAVFHGEAGYFLLEDAPYQQASGKPGGNPNKQIIQSLLDAGVRLELCKSTMQHHGWTDADVLPGVQIAAGAYPRIIDLQLRGFAYIRF